jgi:GGDEF domain-containing protein
VAANAEVRPAPIAWSVGQAMFDAEAPHTLEELLAEADQAMYVQKQARRSGGG